MTYEYHYHFQPGTKLVLELKSKEIYEGKYADGGKDRIVLTDVIQHNNKNKLGDLYEFYRNEIVQIHMLKLPAAKESREKEEHKEVPKNNKGQCKLIKICEEDYFRLKETSESYIYIDIVDKTYYDAISILKNAETIGVVSLGMDKDRLASYVKLLVLCTWKQVYIFDLINLKKREIYPEIKDILESEYICKVIHKSGGLLDILYRHYKIYVQNVFDTQVVDLVLQKKEMGTCSIERSLSDCLVHYLNIPSSLLQRALEVSTKKWNERPLADKTKLFASQIATYLIVLKDHMQKLLLKDIYSTITKVQDQVYDFDDFQFLNYVSKNEVPKTIQNLIPE